MEPRSRQEEVSELALNGDKNVVEAAVLDEPSLARGKDSGGRSLLHWAAMREEPDLLDFLKGQPGSETLVDAADEGGATPLASAAAAGRLASMRRLLDWGASPNSASATKQSPLHLAVSKGHSHAAALLLKHGADANAADHRGATPLHRAATTGQRQIAALLLSQPSIRLNPRDAEGETPLHNAVEDGNEEVALDLVKAGADLSILNKAEKSPLDLAKTSSFRAALKAATPPKQIS